MRRVRGMRGRARTRRVRGRAQRAGYEGQGMRCVQHTCVRRGGAPADSRGGLPAVLDLDSTLPVAAGWGIADCSGLGGGWARWVNQSVTPRSWPAATCAPAQRGSTQAQGMGRSGATCRRPAASVCSWCGAWAQPCGFCCSVDSYSGGLTVTGSQTQTLTNT